MVQFGDGAVKAQIGTPDMHLPIQYALTFPQRLPLQGPRIDFCKLGCLEFFEPDPMRFPNLALAFECLRRGGNAGAVLNAANEVAVAGIPRPENPLHRHRPDQRRDARRTTLRECVSLEEYRRTDREARQTALSIL